MFVNLYNVFEETDFDCFQEKKCFIGQDPINLPPNIFLFFLPKMTFLFEDTEETTLISVRFAKDNKSYNDLLQQTSQTDETITTPSIEATTPSLSKHWVINYKNQTIGEINSNTTKEEINQMLTLESEPDDGVFYYEEGMSIIYNKEDKVSTIAVTNILNKSSFSITLNNPKQLSKLETLKGAALSEILLNQFFIIQPENENEYVFLNKIYNLFEEPSANCFQEGKCFLKHNSPQPGIITFYIPKMTFFFSNPVIDQTTMETKTSLISAGITFSEDIPLDPQSETSEDSSLENPVKSFIIDYQNQSVGEIDFNITKEEANQILTLKSENNNFSDYKEGISIQWNDKGKAVSITIIKNENSQLLFDKKESLITQLSDGIKYSDTDSNTDSAPNLRMIIEDLYNIFENTNIDCVEEDKCQVIVDTTLPKFFGIKFPKMILWFSETKKNLIVLEWVSLDNSSNSQSETSEDDSTDN